MITAETHGPTQAEIIASIIQDAQDAIELATGERVALSYMKAEKPLPVAKIANAVCDTLNVTIEEIKSKRRTTDLVFARMIITLLYYDSNGRIPYPVAYFTNKDRSTISHQAKTGEDLLLTNWKFREKYLACRQEIEEKLYI